MRSKFKHHLLVALIGLFFVVGSAFAASTDNITARVKISLCGDGVAEGPEECDGADFWGLDCTDFNYTSGSLSCTPACEIDLVGCSGYSEDGSYGGGSVDRSAKTDQESGEDMFIQESGFPFGINPEARANLGNIVRPEEPERALYIQEKVTSCFDINGDGSIKGFLEVRVAVENWLSALYNQNVLDDYLERCGDINGCDINLDGGCDLTDFSILLYFSRI